MNDIEFPPVDLDLEVKKRERENYCRHILSFPVKSDCFRTSVQGLKANVYPPDVTPASNNILFRLC